MNIPPWVAGITLAIAFCVTLFCLRSLKIARRRKDFYPGYRKKEIGSGIREVSKLMAAHHTPANISSTTDDSGPGTPPSSIEPLVEPLCSKPLVHLKAYLDKQTHLHVLQHFCGKPLPHAPSNLNDAVFVGLGMEWFERKPNPITEIGLAVMPASALISYSQAPEGLFLDLLQHISVFHCHIIETCHLVNQILAPDASDNFQFGKSRYTTHKEAQQVLKSILTSHTYPDGTPRPVILLGHGLREDKAKLRKEMGIDVDTLENVVFIMETRPLAVEANLIENNGGKLSDLVTGFGITPVHLHNAWNDIANATILALLIGFKERLFPEPRWKQWLPNRFPANPTIDVIPTDDIMRSFQQVCKSKHPPPWGIPSFCYRCEATTHTRMKCTAVIEQPCTLCLAAQGPRNKGIRAKAKQHRAERCGWSAYIRYEDPPDWVRTLSRVQRKEFQIAKSSEDYETLGRLVCAAYPRPMRDESLEDEEGEALAIGASESPEERAQESNGRLDDDNNAEENLAMRGFGSPRESADSNCVDGHERY
ncbi:uncharacterized protein EI97DRAFT_416170 [Westerdykella ornata]|uniref:Gfd2/YDR514C-like C-terminal domain-containing protein n=1 Tax=Westerdykella ornata TaxID=318751 RepID=A0A6A6JLI0_WESOR|nr:uncharacterized protein EI97DRAFT_416170 [Westerdykella ornata]KAF2277362.1 hypothetical protein EI97DRAFT_416170 [Westerdykella ornata]